MTQEPELHPLAGQLLLDGGELLVGDAALIVLRILLEHDVGYIACDVVEPENSLDDAVAGVHQTVLLQRQIRLRLRRDSSTARALIEPSTRAVSPQPGAVVVPSGEGARRMLGVLGDLETAAPVVVLSMNPADVEGDAVVAHASVAGLRRAIDEGFDRASETQRPVVVVLGEDAMAVRGTYRCRMSSRDVDAIGDVAPEAHAGIEHIFNRAKVEIPSGVIAPARAERARRTLPPPVALVLELTQSEIGLPTRLHPAYPTFRAKTGALFTVIDANRFAAMGLQCAAPEARHSLFVVHGTGGAVGRLPQIAADLEIPLELANIRRPIDAARAIARTCLETPGMPKVLYLADVVEQTVVRGEVGVEPAFGGLSTAAAAWIGERDVTPVAAGGDASRTMQLMPRTPVVAASHIDSLAPVVPGWYEVRKLDRASRVRRVRASLVRRVTALMGVAS